MASTSHGHIGVSTIIPPTPEPQINYRAYEIKKFLSETNPGYITPGESKNNTIIYKSPSFAILSGAQKFEDSLLSYGGICFEGEIDVDPETIEVIEINQLNASEYGVAWSTSNPSLSLVSENNGNYHYELSISYTVSLSQSSSLDRVAAVNLNQDVSDWVPELGYDVWGVHGMYRYSTMSTGPDVYFGAKLELDGNLITVNPQTTVTESFTFYSDDFNITLPSGHQWIFQSVEWLNGEIAFEFKSGSTRATVTVIDSNLELETDEPSTGYGRWVYTVTLRIQNGSAWAVAVKGPYLPNDDVQFIDSKYGFVSGAFPVEVYADPAEPTEEDLAKPIRRGWVKAIVGNEIVNNKLMPIYANKRIIKGWIGDENNHPRFIFKTIFKDFEEIEDTSGYYDEYVDRDHAAIIKYQDTNYLISVSPYQIVPWDSTNNQFDITQNEDTGGFFPQGTSNYFVGCLSRVVCAEFDGSLHFFSVEHPGNSEEDSWIWRHWKKTKTNNVWTYDQISYPTGENGAYPSTETYMDDCDKILYSLGNVVDHRYGIEPWIAVSYNNKIYIFCKAYADTLLTLVKWDEETRYTNKVIYEGTGGWNGFDVLPGVMYRGKMHFIITGLLNGVATTRHLVFDFKTEQVVQLQDVQMDIFGATAVSINDEIHVIGSDNSKRLHKSWDGNTWSTQPTLPVDMARDLAGVIDNHLHIFSEVSDNQNYSVEHYISDGTFN